jgi:hypothetical protein
MKTKKFPLLVICAMATSFLVAQEDVKVNPADSTGLPGDQFSLQGALDMFKTSTSLEDFEKKLNSKDNDVNNLDLNGDGNIDYIRVVDNKKDNSHAIILQVPVNETESQDVAVIEIEKTANEKALVQIVGDEELYGDTVIVEPFETKETATPKSGPSSCLYMPIHVIVNVWFWPCVQFIYAPAYVVWVSPWRYHYYPEWWSPWRPSPWRWHYMHCYHYNHYYHPVYHHRVENAHQIYVSHRTTSSVVNHRYENEHNNYNAHRPQQNQTHTNGRHNAQNPRNNNNGVNHVNQRPAQNPNNGKGNRINQRPAQNSNAQHTGNQQRSKVKNSGRRNAGQKGKR